MKAITITAFGGPDVLKCIDRPLPDIKETEVLIKVANIGLNAADLAQRKGRYPAPPDVPADIPGLEVSGIVTRAGRNVKNLKEGDPVCALLSGGGYAEYVAADHLLCLPKPNNISFAEAACLPEAAFTVWENIFRRGKLKKGETVLIHGGSGGIGTSAIQFAKLFNTQVITTAGSEEKCRFCESIGALRSINYKVSDFESELKDTGVDVILDIVGGEYFNKNLRILKNDGRLVMINATSGSHLSFDALDIMRRRLTITGSTLRSADISFKSKIAIDVRKHLWPFVEAKKFQPVIWKIFHLEEASLAHEFMESRQHIGKIILSVDHELQ